MNYASAVIQMLSFLYQNSKDVFAVFHSDEFASVLFSVLLPPETNTSSQTADSDRLITSGSFLLVLYIGT